jgi:general secretion pathway protein G
MLSSKRGGFTLVEILIVVVILGILAAIVIPQFTNASESAKASSLVSQLQTIRSQLELAQVQHAGTYPTLALLQADRDSDGNTWDVLTTKTEPQDAAYTAGDDSGNEVGPYLQQAPLNPFTQSSTVVAAGSPAADAGWTYDEDTGQIKAVLPASADPAKLGLSALDYEQVSGS